MIRIQTWNNAPRRIQTGGINPGAQPALRSVSGTAEDRTLDAMLQGGLTLTDIAVREYVADETARVSQSLQQMNAELAAERERYMQENQGQNALKAGEHFENFARELAEKHLEDGKFQGRFAREFVQQAAGSALHFTEQGRSYAGQQRAAWQDSLLEGEISEFQNQVAQNYDNKDWIEFNLAHLVQRVEAMRPGLDNRALLDGVRKNAAEGVIEGFLSAGRIGDARGAFSQYRDMLGDRANAVKVRIDARADALQAKAEANRGRTVREILKGEKDALYLAEMGNSSDLEDMARRLRAAGATEEAEALENQTTAFRESAQVLRSAAELPLPEAAGKLKELDAELDAALEAGDADRHRALSSTRDLLTRQLSARADALSKDPAAAAESAALFQPGQFQLPDDASMEDRVSARMDWQRKNGVSDPVPLTLEEVERFAEQYGKTSSPGDFVAMLSESFGGQNGEALKQLVTSGKLSPDANLALNMPREAANLLMLMNDKNAVKEAERALAVDAAAKQDIDEAVRSELEDILGTFAAQGASGMAAQTLDACYKLSLKYMERGMSAGDAGERAAREVMAERYEVRGGYRVPRDYDADRVELGAKRLLKELASSETVAMNAVPGLTEEMTKAKRAAILTAGGRWVTNADESGLLLTVNGAPVLDADGKPVQATFEELAARGENREKGSS